MDTAGHLTGCVQTGDGVAVGIQHMGIGIDLDAAHVLGQTQTVAGAGGCAAGQLGGDGAAVGAPGLAASTAAAQLICYNQNRAIPERGRQPRADGGADEI